MPIEDLSQEISVDITEPEPMRIGEALFQESPYLWHVELYLMSKYAPEFVEATIFKVKAAATERAKIVKESHEVLMSIQALQNAIESDLVMHTTWKARPSHKTTSHARPGIGGGYQRELDRL